MSKSSILEKCADFVQSNNFYAPKFERLFVYDIINTDD